MDMQSGFLCAVCLFAAAACATISGPVKKDIEENGDVAMIRVYDEHGKEAEKPELEMTTEAEIARAMGFISHKPSQVVKCDYDGRLLFIDTDRDRIIFEGRFCHVGRHRRGGPDALRGRLLFPRETNPPLPAQKNGAARRHHTGTRPKQYGSRT